MIRRRPLRPWISIHDVMPETLPAVREIIAELRALGLPLPLLLVVPGRAWAPADLRQLQTWQQAGCELAAHGWHHHVQTVRGLRHRLHAALISADVAEHLALPESEIRALMQRSHAWFADNGLRPPRLYVPPAWALGRISSKALRGLPFSHVETTGGLTDLHEGRRRPLPLVGFEARAAWQVHALRQWNRLQIALARASGRRLRVAIHPDDFTLELADDLKRLLAGLSRQQLKPA